MEYLDSYKELAEMVNYNAVSGEITWKVAPSPAHPYLVGRKVGVKDYSVNKWIVRHKGRVHTLSILCWFIYYQEMPKERVHYRDGDRFNLKIDNLYLAERLESHKTWKHKRTNKSGVRGVSWDKSRCKWVASLKVAGEVVLRKRYDTFQEAVDARKKAEKKYW